MNADIKLFWIRDDRDKRNMFLEYTSRFGETFPEVADILAAVDNKGNLMGFSAVLSTEVISDILIFRIEPGESVKDIGHLMLREIENVIEGTGIGMIRFVMPRVCFFADEGYDIVENGTEYAVLFSSLTYSDVYRKIIEEEEVQKARSISECTRKEQKFLKDFFIKNEVATMDFFNPVLSSVVIEGSEVMGLFLCETKPEGIIIYHMYAAADHPEYLIDCLRVLDKKLSEYKDEDPGLMLSFATGNDNEVSLLRYLSGNVVPIEEFVRDCTAVKILKAM